MSALSDAARDYLRLRNRLGHELAEYHRELPRFVAALDTAGLPTVTITAALSWAQERGVDPLSSVPARRMTITRGFARYLAGIDARTEVPPPGLIAAPQRWRPPFIYSTEDIALLLTHARRLRQPMPAATHETLVGLLAVTGVRVEKPCASTAATSTGQAEYWRSANRSSANRGGFPCGNQHWPPWIATRRSVINSAHRQHHRASCCRRPAPACSTRTCD